MTAQVGPDSTMTTHVSKGDYVQVIRAMRARDRNKGACTLFPQNVCWGKFQVTRTTRVTQSLVPRDHRPIARAVDILLRAQETV